MPPPPPSPAHTPLLYPRRAFPASCSRLTSRDALNFEWGGGGIKKMSLHAFFSSFLCMCYFSSFLRLGDFGDQTKRHVKKGLQFSAPCRSSVRIFLNKACAVPSSPQMTCFLPASSLAQERDKTNPGKKILVANEEVYLFESVTTYVILRGRFSKNISPF